MEKNLTPKIVFVVILAIGAALALWWFRLKPGIDLAGGVSLIYEIDAEGLEPAEKKDLSARMITVLRRRIDPVNIQNLIWRPQGPTRFEIQMPLASAKARRRRQNYKKAESELLAENVSRETIMHSVQKGAAERTKDFEKFAQDRPERLEILDSLATAYDELKEKQEARDRHYKELATAESMMPLAGMDVEQVKANAGWWITLDDSDPNESELTKALKDFLGENRNLDMLKQYVSKYSEWAEVVEQITEPETGKRVKYKESQKELHKLSLSEEQINSVLEMDPKSKAREEAIDELKTKFEDRSEKIERVVKAFKEYRDFRGRLDDPSHLRRMLKGAGILEFRILPTVGHPEVDSDEMARYVETLTEQGPKYASDNKHVWCEIENRAEWRAADEQGGRSIVAPFGNKWYALASNKAEQMLLHSTGAERAWKLERARPTQDDMGLRAIGFRMDGKGTKLFADLTGKNLHRPLCILLDGIAISAPNIQDRIWRDGRITGSFTQTEVEDMVNKLNAGSLPARLIEQPISIKTIGPSIGVDNRDRGIKAGLIGLVVVVLCMAAYYTLAGSIADLALLLNLLFVLAIMALVRATFTLPGIAGMILTIGMSVDANVLIFERIREEQQRGSSLRIAVRNGYQRAFRTILDANLTTFITAAILFWVASEEIKGFAIVLMLGIGSSLFTALFVTRVVFDILLSKRIIKDHLVMLRLIHQPRIDWMGLRPIFFCISTALIGAGLFIFFTRDNVKNNKYGHEFTGGTSVEITLKDALDRDHVEERIRQIGDQLNNRGLAAANVYSIGNSKTRYEINTTETNRTTTTVTFSEPGAHEVETITSAIKKTQAKFDGRLSNLVVRAESNPGAFVVTTSQANKSLVKNVLTAAFPEAEIGEPVVDEIVNNAIRTAFKDELEIQQNLRPTIISEEKTGEEVIDANPELSGFLGGMAITCTIETAATPEEIHSRLGDLVFKPDMRDLRPYSYTIVNADLTAMEPNQPVKSFAYVSVEDEAGLRKLTEDEWAQFSDNERRKVLAAAELEASLPRVTQIDPSVGAEAKNQAQIAIVLSLFAIVTYIWIRFGNARYGIAAIVALVHDVCITLGAVTVCTYIASRWIGEILLIGDFKINLAMIAAFLTLIGYSLNDTIVVFDRIRENRKKAQLNQRIITDSINQTISRTLLTSFTTFIVVLIMYIFGGHGLRGFTFAIGFGIIIGTYSSIAIAAPVLLLGVRPEKKKGK